MNNTLPLFQGWRYGIKYVSILAWVFFLVIPVSLVFYRWIEMPGMRLGEIVIQGVEKLRRKKSVDLSRNIATQEKGFTTIDAIADQGPQSPEHKEMVLANFEKSEMNHV
jgi:hypothetical protein